MNGVEIESGFAKVGAGAWLMSRAQPAAFSGKVRSVRRKGWMVRDRSRICCVETTGSAHCADASRPFLTHIPCAAPVNAVSGKVLVAPQSAWAGARLLKTIPMSFRGAICVTQFAQRAEPASEPAFAVMATASRTARVAVEDGGTLSVRPASLVAWTGKDPTGYCAKITVWDIILPRAPRDMLLTFYGPAVVWLEGSYGSQASAINPRRRCAYGV